MQHVFVMANHVTALLNGATDPDPSQHGMTSEEERSASSNPQVGKLQEVSACVCSWAGFQQCTHVTSNALIGHNMFLIFS